MPEYADMITLHEAFEIVDEALADIRVPTETVAIGQALGRTLMADQASRLDLPPFDKSAMDGYAIPAGDDRDEYRVIESVAAGEVPTRKLQPGTALKVMTGAPVPEGSGKVIRVERTSEADGVVRVLKGESMSNICLQGEDVRSGDVILHAPAVLGPLEIANIIACGISEVEVARPIRISIISTGEEIVDSPEELVPGKIMNTNGPMLDALCRMHGLEVVKNEVVPDERDATVSALREALGRSDIVVFSGGVSMGDFDFVGEALGGEGLKFHFGRVAVKPGRPIAFASSPQAAAFGLPGNPVSVYVTFHLFVLRAARLMVGGRSCIKQFEVPLGRDFQRHKGRRTEYIPCRLLPDGTAVAVEYHGSAHLLALLESDGFFVVSSGVTSLSAGDTVDFVSIRGRL